MAEATLDVVTFGETMAVLTSAEPVPLRFATSLQLGLAGAESNVAIGVRRLGGRAAWMGRVGDDEFGRLVLGRLRGEDVDVAAATVDRDAPTGLMIKARRTAAVTHVSYYRRGSAASRLAPENLDEERIRAAGVLHVTGITPALSASARESVHAAVDVARAAGTAVSFDPNHRSALWRADEAANCYRDLAARADIVLVGVDEAELMHGAGSAEELAAALHRAGVPQAVVKRGREGVAAYVDGRPYSLPATAADVVDPVGAGDAFAAGYLTALVEGASPQQRLELAAAVGAFAVTVRGDWEGLPDRRELALARDAARDVHR